MPMKARQTASHDRRLIALRSSGQWVIESERMSVAHAGRGFAGFVVGIVSAKEKEKRKCLTPMGFPYGFFLC